MANCGNVSTDPDRTAGDVMKKEKSDREQAINREHEELLRWFQSVKFKKKLFGGVDEVRLWKKLEELNQLYEAAIRAERIRYDALLKDHTRASNALIRRYRHELAGKIVTEQKTDFAGEEQE